MPTVQPKPVSTYDDSAGPMTRHQRAVPELYAWLGAAAFVGSLIYFGLFYFVEMGHAVPTAPVLPPIVANGLLFGAFALHHSLMARPAAKAWLGRRLPPELERSTYVWVSSLLFFVVCRAWVDVPGVIYVIDSPWAWCSFAVQAAGLALIYRSTAVLDVLELAGIRQAQTARATSALGTPRLHMTGPYSIVRHPLYLGWILALFAAPTMTANRLAFAAISSVYLVAAIPWEERSLAALFGSRYHDYATRVRWRVLPGIY